MPDLHVVHVADYLADAIRVDPLGYRAFLPHKVLELVANRAFTPFQQYPETTKDEAKDGSTQHTPSGCGHGVCVEDHHNESTNETEASQEAQTGTHIQEFGEANLVVAVEEGDVIAHPVRDSAGGIGKFTQKERNEGKEQSSTADAKEDPFHRETSFFTPALRGISSQTPKIRYDILHHPSTAVNRRKQET
jgi:hypothetical protein